MHRMTSFLLFLEAYQQELAIHMGKHCLGAPGLTGRSVTMLGHYVEWMLY
jgi:hypothetical protein